MQEMYERQRAQQEAAYQNTLSKLSNSYKQGQQNLNQNADDALRQAYIAYKKGQLGLTQDLANRGINGGATESILADLYNTYGSNRAAIDKERVNGLADLAAQYQQGVANAGANYGGDYTNMLNNFYNSMIGLRENYASDLANALKNAASVSARTSASANNEAVDNTAANPWGNYTEKDVISTVSNLKNSPSAILNYLDRFPGATDAEKEMILFSAGIDPASLYMAISGANNAPSVPVNSTTTNNSYSPVVPTTQTKTSMSGGGRTR